MMSAALTLVAVVVWVAMEEFEMSGLQVENESEVGSRVWLFELIGIVVCKVRVNTEEEIGREHV